MPLKIRLETEWCEPYEKTEPVIAKAGQGGVLARLMPDIDDDSFPFLRFVDPYGDTVFNYLQMPQFLFEWRRLRERATTVDEFEMLDKVENLARICAERPDPIYLKFIGD